MCGGNLTAISGQFGIFDDDKDGLYSEELNCKWYITVNEQTVVRLFIDMMDIDSRHFCIDKLQVSYIWASGLEKGP